MSTHIVFSVPCLWQGGIHSLQGLPSILLIKQWLCTQPIQGRENATQRDKNIKHLAIWGGRVPNNDSLVIVEALFFISLLTPPQKNSGWRRNICDVLMSPSVTVTLVKFSFAMSKGKKREIVNMEGGEGGGHQLKDEDWFEPPPSTLNSVPCNLFSACFCCHQGQSFPWPYKGSSLRLKSSSHKILFEINSVTFTMERQTHCQTHHDLRHCWYKLYISLLISSLWVILEKWFFFFFLLFKGFVFEALRLERL